MQRNRHVRNLRSNTLRRRRLGSANIRLQHTDQGSQRYLIKWTPQGNSNNFTSRIAYNVTYPLAGITAIDDGIGFYYGVAPESVSPSGAFDTETGKILWTKMYTINEAHLRQAPKFCENGVYVYPTLLR